jgi:hypothetical protein
MFKKRLIAIITALALTVAVAGASGVVADSMGLSVTPQAHACGGNNGGGC